MRIAFVNVVWDAAAPTPEATLDRFTTLTGWADAVRDQDRRNSIIVCQRFHHAAEITRADIVYQFVAEEGPPTPPSWYRGRPMIDAVVSLSPDVVHVNGLGHPRLVRRLRRALPASCAIVVQDHGGFDPATLSPQRKVWMRHGLGAADGLLVAARRQVEAFRASGLVPASVRIHDVMEASTRLAAAVHRERHRPLSLLWVGRLNANKDPLTVVEGFARFVARTGVDATLTFVYGSAELEAQVRQAVQTGPHRAVLDKRVRLIGAVAPAGLVEFYDAADLFVLGSHREGSGYAVLEALACGVVPVITDIPSFRSLTDEGRIGMLWRAGDADSLAEALERAVAAPTIPAREACRAWFDAQFSWEAIGRRAIEIYRTVAPRSA